MKIYKPTPTFIIRVQIIRQGEETQYINLCDTTQNKVVDHITKTIENQKLSVFAKGNSTKIDIRECLGGKNGKSKSISFKGLSTKETLDIITKSIN
jgi:hypothetical protein